MMGKCLTGNALIIWRKDVVCIIARTREKEQYKSGEVKTLESNTQRKLYNSIRFIGKLGENRVTRSRDGNVTFREYSSQNPYGPEK